MKYIKLNIVLVFFTSFCMTLTRSFAAKINIIESAAKFKHVDSINRVYLNVRYDQALPGDTMFFYKLSPFYTVTAPHENAFAATRDEQGRFQFSIETKESDGYFVLVLRLAKSINNGRRDSLLTPDFLFESGDSLSIAIIKNLKSKSAEDSFIRFDYKFSGRGSRKLELLRQADSLQRTIGESALPIFNQRFHYQDPCIQKVKSAYAFMANHKEEISPLAYNCIQADIVYQKASMRINIIMDYYSNYVKRLSKADIARFLLAYSRSITDTIPSFPISQLGLLRSFQYLRYLEYKNRTKCYLENNERRIPSVILNQIIKDYRGELRDRLVTSQLFRYQNDEYFKQQMQVVEEIVKTPYCLTAIRRLVTRQKGFPAYKFNLPNDNGSFVKMEDLFGKVVVMDFWFTGCDWCTTFYKDVISKAEEKYYGDQRVIFVTVSTDKDKEKWLTSIKSGRYTSDKAINLYTNGQGATHPIIRHYTILKYPSFLIINKSGQVELFNTEELRFSSNKMIDKIADLLKR